MESQDAIFLNARDMADPAERAAYLTRACGKDADLRQRVEALVRDATGAEEFFGPEGTVVRGSSATEGPGTVIGRFKLLQKIGEGGMGVVYMAEQREPVTRKVAFKIIKLGMDTQQVIARFEAERQALALMDHPNIAKVLDGGVTESGRPYFVMDLVPGLPITQFCDEANLPTRDRLELFLEVCSAIQHAHQKGIIHRDIKPSNILVTLHGDKPVPKVIDFGVAKATQGRLTEKTLFTQFQQFIGTPAYMSPEQASLSGLDVDTRSDIYALGVLLYELLAGQTPFDGKELLQAGLDEMRRTIREKEPARPSTRLSTMQAADATLAAKHRQTDALKLIHALRGDLDWIVMKALEKDRARRYETANGLARDIQRHLHDEPVVARPPSKLYLFRKLVRRNKLAFAAGTVIVALLVFGFCAATLAALRIRRDNQDIRKAKDEATEKLRTSYLAEARANRNSGRAGRRFDSLEAVRKAAAIRADLAVRNEAIACMTVSDLRESKHADLVGHAADDLVCYDLKLERYAIGESNGNIRVHTVADDQVQAVLPAPGWEVSWIQSFSPDSRYLKVIYRQPQPPAVSVWVWDMETQTAVLKELSGEWAANFSSDSRFFAMCHTNGTISIYDLTSGHERNHLPGTRLFRQLILNPGNTRLACANEDDPRVEIREVESGRVVTNLVCPPGVSCVAWTPDGKRLATAGMDFHSYRIYLWEVETGQRLATLEGHENYITSVAFNHAGNLLASAGWDTLIRLWDAGAGSQIASHPGGSLFLGFSPDDRYLLGWQNLARYGSLKVACSQEFRQLHSRRGYGNNSAPEFSADGRILAVRTDQVRFWDVFHGQEIGSMALPLCDAHLFSPDGKSLILIDRTNGTFQCSVERIGAAPSLTIRLGRPRLLTTATAEKDFNIANHAALSLDGRHLAVTHESGSESFVFDLQHPEASPVVLKPHFKADRIAISPDGHWAATASWHDSFVKVWDAASGNPLRTLPMPAKRSSLAFSPDGRWLATSTTEYQLWEVGSWQPRGPPRPGFGIPELNSTAFSPDGRVMARTSGGNRIQLLETATEKPLATLEPPGSITWVGRSSFSPDGTRLAAMQGDQQVQLWDLRLLRQELAEMHLDWDMPPYPPLVQAMASPVTLEIESDPTNSASTK